MTLPIAQRRLMWQYDAGTAQRAGGLATPQKWRVLAKNDVWIWGHIATGDTFSYNTAVKLDQNTAQCDCPVKKTPCKHQLGLLMLFESQPERFIESELPAWVKLPKSPKPAEDPQTDTAQHTPWVTPERLAAMQEGTQILLQWLEDQLRFGLAPMLDNPQPLHALATRLNDAKLGGLSGRISALTQRWLIEPDPLQALAKLFAHLHTVATALQKYDHWPHEVQIPLLRACGVQLPKEKVRMEAQTATDTWCALSVSSAPVADNPTLTMQKIYLWGVNTGHWALAIQYFLSNSQPDQAFRTNAVYSGTVYYYPSAIPFQALTDLTPSHQEANQFWPKIKPDTFDQVAAAHRQALRLLPWADMPLFWVQAAVIQKNNAWWLVNDRQQALPIDTTNLMPHQLHEAAATGFATCAICPAGRNIQLIASVAFNELISF
jgi:hypothetical protein